MEGAEGLAGLPELVKSQRVLEDVINELHLSLVIAELRPKVSASRINGSSLVRITVTDSHPATAISIVNGVVKKLKGLYFGAQGDFPYRDLGRSIKFDI